MSTDQEQRVRAAVRDLADAVPVVPPPAASLRARARQPRRARMTGRWLAPAVAATSVLALVATAAVIPGWFAGPEPTDRPALPTHLAGASSDTASLAASPLAPASAVYSMRFFGAHPHDHDTELVIAGTDGSTYRQLDPDELARLSSGHALTTTDPVLSPDGTRLAGSGGYVIDLATGEGARYPLVGTDSQGDQPLLAWSHDSRLLAYGDPAGLAVLDTATGDVALLDQGRDARQAAFSPDGTEIAIFTPADSHDAPGQVTVLGRFGGWQQRELEVAPAQELGGEGTAWSPDGRLLAMFEWTPSPWRTTVTFLDAAGTGAPVPAPVQLPYHVDLLGWSSPETMLVWAAKPGQYAPTIEAVSVDGGDPQTLSRMPDQPNGSVRSVHVASGLLAGAGETAPPGSGSPPVAYLVAGTVAAAAIVLLAVGVGVVVRRRARHRPWLY